MHLIDLTFPQGLVLGLVLLWLYLRRLRRRNLWRALLLALAILLVCDPSLLRPTRALDLYVLADRSRSIAEEGRAKQAELLGLIAGRLRPGDRLGIVSFNDKAYLEQIASAPGAFKSFSIPYSEDASDLNEGLQFVLSQIDDRRPTRILVLSDGEATGPDPRPSALAARQRAIPIDYRAIERLQLFNLSVGDAILPEQILSGEPFRVSFKVAASTATPGRYRLWRDGRIVGRGPEEGWRPFSFQAGENTIAFNDLLPGAGTHAYKMEVEALPPGREKMLADNFAERFVKVVGERPLLVVNNTGAPDNVSRLLSAAGLACHTVAIGNLRLSIGQLSGYKGIILNNVPVLGLPLRQIEDLRAFVDQEGGGLLVCGGNRSFSAGGYYKSALESVLPVSLEDRQQSKKVATAFSIAMDRSGSMAMRTPSGQTKIALANSAVVECIGLMSPIDTVSVIAVDSMAHIMIPQQPVENPAALAADVRRIDSMGGGIFIYNALRAAADEILKASQLNKHILLFADAADSEEPGDYKALLEQLVGAGVTVSVVGLGTERDSDAELLKDIAARGKGTVYFTNDAAQLTQFFTADTITYTRNSFISEPAPMQVKAAARAISPEQAWRDFTCAGYNLLFSKPQADIALLTADEDRAPTLAFWQRGLGRAAALALDVEGPFAAQPQYGDILLSITRWMMGSSVEDNLQIRVAYEGNTARVQLEVSQQEREHLGAVTLQVFTPKGVVLSRPLAWDAHNRLSASFKLGESGCYRGVIQLGDRAFRIPPVSLPVSPEFIHDREPDFGRKTLAQLASLTDGHEVLDVRDIFARPTRASAVTPLLLPLLIAYLIFLLLEIAEPRFGLLALLGTGFSKGSSRLRAALGALRGRLSTASPAPASAPRATRRGPLPVSPQPDDPQAEIPQSATPNPQPEPPPDMDYLAKTKAQSSRTLRSRPDREKRKE